MKIMREGGTINADFQCGTLSTTVLIGGSVAVVLNSCKDFLPSPYWVCICFPGLRYVHVDVREFGLSAIRRTSKSLRVHMAEALKARFASVDEIWKWARAKDFPRADRSGSAALA